MRWTLFAAAAAIAAGLWLPGEAAPPAAPASIPAVTGDSNPITFEQYRLWRDNFIARRRSELAAQLDAADLPADRKARLQRVKSYYDGLAAMGAAERDRLYRERFDRIDSDHDGTIDAAERAAWHDQRRALYSRGGTARGQRAAADAAR